MQQWGGESSSQQQLLQLVHWLSVTGKLHSSTPAGFVGEQEGELSVDLGDKVKVRPWGAHPHRKGMLTALILQTLCAARPVPSSCPALPRLPQPRLPSRPCQPLQVHSEVDGWARVIRLSDNRTGLVPCWAVSLD